MNDYPKKIYAIEKVETNGIHCIDYKTDNDIEYIQTEILINKIVEWWPYEVTILRQLLSIIGEEIK